MNEIWTLLRKELGSFFSSLIGYLVIGVFLILNALFLWVFPGQYNILDGGYATLSALFFISPWIFMFLVPAVTMRLFADEQRTGTIELLFTHPLTDIQIILAKYLAGLSLVLFSLVPTFLYYISVYWLGDPQGNLDTGATWGSYIGLFFLAAIYVAIGLFASSVTDNQIVAFIVGMLLCLVFYSGFDALSELKIFGDANKFVLNIGIGAHYQSMSRGVVDLRDVVYFVSVIALFCLLTKTILQSRKW